MPKIKAILTHFVRHVIKIQSVLPWFEAVRNGDCERVQAMLVADASWAHEQTPYGSLAEHGCTALMLAARENDVPMLRTLLPYSNPKATNREGHSALHKAAEQGALESLRLLSPHSDLEQASVHYRITPLMSAAQARKAASACVDWLLQEGADACATTNRLDTALMLATKPETVKALLPHSKAQAKDCKGETALMKAAYTGNVPLLDILILAGFTNEVDADGRSALLHAIESSHFECFKRLLPVSDVTLRDRNGCDAADCLLSVACESECSDNPEAWSCLDRLASSLELDRAREIASAAPVGWIPAIQAMVERGALDEHLRGEPDTRKTGVASQPPGAIVWNSKPRASRRL